MPIDVAPSFDRAVLPVQGPAFAMAAPDDPIGKANRLVIVIGYENAHDLTGAADDASAAELTAALQTEFDGWTDKTGVFLPAPKTADDITRAVQQHMDAHGITRLADIQIISHGYPEVITPLKPHSQGDFKAKKSKDITYIGFMDVATQLAPLTAHLDTTACRLFSRLEPETRACYAEIADIYDCDIDGSARMNYGTATRPAGLRLRFGADGQTYRLDKGALCSELRGIWKQGHDRLFTPCANMISIGSGICPKSRNYLAANFSGVSGRPCARLPSISLVVAIIDRLRAEWGGWVEVSVIPRGLSADMRRQTFSIP